jgi:hypothetical protein
MEQKAPQTWRQQIWRQQAIAMSGHGKAIAEKLDDERWEQLFQKTIEAIELFGERPDLLSGFVNALRTGEFRTPQRPPDPDRRRDVRAAVMGLSRAAARQRRT